MPPDLVHPPDMPPDLVHSVVLQQFRKLEFSNYVLNVRLKLIPTNSITYKYIIGRGAHGTVYKAFLGQTGVYAVKKLMFGASKEGSTSRLKRLKKSDTGILRDWKNFG
ncbi:hypothetical protein L2E82_00556 [Cichorium intybus]|uniref:Uncharacterized protein n=1 Tax=Cichorium intybus TaxID=13427 RepID=A0ACB9GXD8_CICIN|nr:hypothetical protein L2E82_00556 [Cichorium intybus]